jgi:hypothetical protein
VLKNAAPYTRSGPGRARLYRLSCLQSRPFVSLPVSSGVIRLRYSEKRFLSVWSVWALGKRKLIQGLSMLLCNADILQFKTGSLSKSPLKNTCVPGLNCYSCPGAIAACPLGALQNALAEGRVPFFVTGLLVLFGVLLGRGVCGFLCPFGLIQELLYKIPGPKVRKNALTRKLTGVNTPSLPCWSSACRGPSFSSKGMGRLFSVNWCVLQEPWKRGFPW